MIEFLIFIIKTKKYCTMKPDLNLVIKLLKFKHSVSFIYIVWCKHHDHIKFCHICEIIVSANRSLDHGLIKVCQQPLDFILRFSYINNLLLYVIY